MLQITLMISKVSSKDAQRATTHVRQLAVATGAPDWEGKKIMMINVNI